MSASGGRRSGRLLLGVVLVAAALVAGAMYLLRDHEPESAGSGVPLVGSLRPSADSIARIEIASGSGTIVLARNGDAWVVESSGGYPADFGSVRALVSGIASLEREEALTSRKERHAELGLAWPDEKGVARLVRLMLAQGEPIEVVLGETRTGPESQYARLLGDDQTWRCKGMVAVETAAPRYMNAQLLALGGDETIGVRYLGLELSRRKPTADGAAPTPAWDASLAAGPMDEGFWPESAQTQATSALPTWLNRLDFDDVRPRSDGLAQSWKPDAAYSIEFDTVRAIVRVEGMPDGDAVWVRLSAEAKPDAPADALAQDGQSQVSGTGTGTGTKPTSPDWTKWNAEMASWEFKLPAWKRNAITRIREQKSSTTPATP